MIAGEPGASVATRRPVRTRGLYWALLALMLAALAWAATRIAWDTVFGALSHADPGWLVLAVAFNLLGMPFWAASVRKLVPGGEPKDFMRVLDVLTVSIAVTQIFSSVSGAATAVVLFVRHGGLSKAAAFTVTALEQVTSGIVKVILVGTAVFLVVSPGVLRTAWLSLVPVISAVLALTIWIAHSQDRLAAWAVGDNRNRWQARMLTLLADWSRTLKPLRRPDKLAAAVAFATSRRLLEAGAVICIQKACGMPASASLALLVIAALAVATILPGPPGNIGLYEAAVTFAYGFAGIDVEMAVAAAVLQHAAYLIAMVVPGYALLAIGRVAGLSQRH